MLRLHEPAARFRRRGILPPPVPFLCDFIGDLAGRLILRVGPGEDLQERVVDALQHVAGLFQGDVHREARDVDQAAGVDDIVRRVEDAAVPQGEAVGLVGQLADPATMAHFRRGRVSSFTIAPMAQGAKMSASAS